MRRQAAPRSPSAHRLLPAVWLCSITHAAISSKFQGATELPLGTWNSVWESMSIKKLNHVSIAVTDMDEALHFYRDVLGLEVTRRQRLEDRQLDIGSAEHDAGSGRAGPVTILDELGADGDAAGRCRTDAETHECVGSRLGFLAHRPALRRGLVSSPTLGSRIK